jgi:hypothetical protein
LYRVYRETSVRSVSTTTSASASEADRQTEALALPQAQAQAKQIDRQIEKHDRYSNKKQMRIL